MARIRRMLAFLLVLTMIFSLGEVLALADGAAPDGDTVVSDGTALDSGVVGDDSAPEAPSEPTEAPGVTPEPTLAPEVTPEPTEEPEVTPEPTQAPEVTPEPTQAPEVSPEPTDEPEASPEPTDEPEASPEPTEDPEASPEPTEEPERKVWPWTEPGNKVVELMGGGWTLTSGSSFYYSEGGGLYLNGTLLVSVNALNLNLSDGWLYYTAGSEVQRVSAGGGAVETVHAAAAYIDQMYVMGQEIRYLAGGSLYSYDMTDGMLETLECPAGTLKFIPTPYGNLFFTGALFSYTLWAEQIQLMSGISSCYTDGDWLVVVANGETQQTSTAALFDGVLALQAYSLHQDLLATNGLSDEAQLANEHAYVESAAYASILADQQSDSSGIATISASAVLTKSLSANQQNIVLRAQQMAEAKWTAQADLYAWGGNDESYVRSKYGTDNGTRYVVDVNNKGSGEINANKKGYFLEGHIYKGVPYSWPVGFGYVGWDISLNDFLRETNTKGGKFYSSYSSYERRAPYYGSDCSGFASYTWDLPQRCTCQSMLKYSQAIGNSISQLEVGDVLNNPNSHVMVVTDIGYNASNQIVSVEITEQTPPKMKVTVYGEVISGRSYDQHISSLNSLTANYLNSGYTIYRRSCNTRPNVNPPEDVLNQTTMPAPAIDSIEAVGPTQLRVALKHEDSKAVIFYTTDGSTPTTNSRRYSSPFTLTQNDVKNGKITIRAMARISGKNQESFVLAVDLGLSATPSLAMAADNSSLVQYDNYFYASAGSELTLTSAAGGKIFYTTDGSNPTAASAQVDSGTKIEAKDGMTIKAFAMADNCLPSAVAEFKVKLGALHTITMDDPYGFIERPDDAEKVYVLEGQSVSFNVRNQINGFNLEKVEMGETKEKLELKQTSDNPISFTNIQKDYTIKTYVKTEYTDLTDNTGKPGWYMEAVAWATAEGLMNGTSTNVFSPTYGASRAMFITVLGRYAKAKLEVSTSSTSHKSIDATTLDSNHRVGITNGIDILVRSQPSLNSATATVKPLEAAGMLIEVTGSQQNEGSIWFRINYDGKTGYVRQINPTNGKVLLDVCNFTDITADNLKYCNGYVQWAYVNDLVKGVNSAQFGATNGISRQDICVILYDYLKNMLGLNLPTSSSSLSRFKDEASIASYARLAVSAMVNIGVVQGDTSGNFAPTRIAQRAQVAQIFLNLDKYLDGKV